MSDSRRNPNVVLVMADDLGWGDVGYNDNNNIVTPHIDEMSRNGVRLDRFYASSPVCSPTRGSCLTGRHPYRFGVWFADQGHLPAEEYSIAAACKEAGMTTGHFGKWHLGSLSLDDPDSTRGGTGGQHYAPPWDRGFDRCFSTESWMPTYNPMVWGGGRWTPDASPETFKWLMDRPVAHGETPEEDDVVEWHGAYWTGPGQRADRPMAGDDSKVVMDEALRFIGECAESESPFLAVIWFHTPHTPLAAGDRHRALYPDQPIEGQHYLGAISAMDEQVGELRRSLRDLRIEEDTMVWFCSDNGPSYMHEHGSTGGLRGRKGTLYEGGLRVPAIVEWPGMLEPSVVAAPTVTSDIVPTVLGVLDRGAPHAIEFDGIDIIALLAGRVGERGSPIGFQSPYDGADTHEGRPAQKAWMAEEYKLVAMEDPDRPALFNIVTDPHEATDLSSVEPDLVDRYARELATWQASCAEDYASKYR